MRKIHRVEIDNTSDKIKQPSIPKSYGNLYMRPGKHTYEIPYDDKWGLTGDQKVDILVKEDKELTEIKKKFKGKVMAGSEEILSEDITEDGEWNPKPSKEGFTLEGLYSDSALQKRVELPIKDIQGDVTLYARFVRQIFTCEVKDTEDKLLAQDFVNYGESWNPSVSRPGFTVEGLYKEKEFKTKVETPVKNVKEGLTLYAKLVPAAESVPESRSGQKVTRETLESLTEDQLKELAEKIGVEGFRRYTRKDSLINAILATVE